MKWGGGGGVGDSGARKIDLSWTANVFCRNRLLKAIGSILKVRCFPFPLSFLSYVLLFLIPTPRGGLSRKALSQLSLHYFAPSVKWNTQDGDCDIEQECVTTWPLVVSP